jgi:hypothetical protein
MIVQNDLSDSTVSRMQFLLSRPILKVITRKMTARALRHIRHIAAINLQIAARARRCRLILRRLERLRDDITAAAAGEFRPSPEMVAAGLTLQRTYRGHMRGRRSHAMLCQWRCKSASTWALKSMCCMFAQLSKRFYAFTKCRSLQIKLRPFRPMFPNYAQQFGHHVWRPSGKYSSWFVQTKLAEVHRQEQALVDTEASAAPYSSCGGSGGYSHRICKWTHFSSYTSIATASCGVSDVALHWLQIQSIRVLRTSASEYFAAPKRLRHPPPRLQPMGRRTIRLPLQVGNGTINFLCAGVFVQAMVRGHRARVVCVICWFCGCIVSDVV